MVQMDEYARVRRAHRDGMTIRELARTFHHSRRKIKEIIAAAEPTPYVRLNPPAMVIDAFKPIIDAILVADAAAPRKQRHTARKIFRRLRDEHGFPGSYDRVRLYLRTRFKSERETFIPLDHDPGQRVELDFGHVYVRQKLDGDGLARAYAMMERQVGHLTRLVDDLLDVSRITRGLVELRQEPVNLAEIAGPTSHATRSRSAA